MSEPELDVIVPVHDPARPVARLAASVLDAVTPLRLTFVCHGIPAALVSAALGEHAADPRVRLMEHHDGVHSPAGPFRAGLARATAAYVMKVDSDDTVESGAVDAWMRVRRSAGADIVICRMRAATGREWPTPPARVPAHRRLDPVRDRLAYRTSTMGIVARELMEAAPPVEGISTGEDIESSLRLWFSGSTIVMASTEPAYLVHDDGPDRATAPRPLIDELAWLPRLMGSGFATSLAPAARAAVATKLLRVQLFGAVAARAERLSPEDLGALREAAGALVELGGGVPPWLARADRDLLDALLAEGSSAAGIAALSARRRLFGRPVTLIPRNPVWALHREAPARMMLASAVARRRRTRRPR